MASLSKPQKLSPAGNREDVDKATSARGFQAASHGMIFFLVSLWCTKQAAKPGDVHRLEGKPPKPPRCGGGGGGGSELRDPSPRRAGLRAWAAVQPDPAAPHEPAPENVGQAFAPRAVPSRNKWPGSSTVGTTSEVIGLLNP